VFPEVFANLPLGAVSIERRSTSLQRDSEPKVVQRVGNPENHALGKAKNFRAIEKQPVLPAIMKALASAQVLGSSRHGAKKAIVRSPGLLAGNFGGQTLAAARTASLNDLATVGGLHASTETVATTPLGTAGL
jgi:hypothetical protein